jgi:hypothetical protein
MIKQGGTMGYISTSGGKIAAILLILICSFGLAWATRSGNGTKSNISAKSAQPLPAHTKQAPINRRPVSPVPHHQRKTGGKAPAKQGAQHKQAVQHSQGAQDAVPQARDSAGAGQTGKPHSDATPTPTPEENPSPTTLGLSARATPMPSP